MAEYKTLNTHPSDAVEAVRALVAIGIPEADAWEAVKNGWIEREPDNDNHGETFAMVAG